MNSPRVSVIVAVKNGEKYLACALESILAQTYTDFEIIVVDGKSTDRSVEIAESYPKLRCIQQVGKGFAGAWNEGIAVANGEYIAILDSDDWWAEGKLEAQVAILDNQPEIDYVLTHMRFVLEPGTPYPPGFKPEWLNSEQTGRFPSAMLMRRSCFDTVGDFNMDWSITSDIEWFARAKDHGMKMAMVPEVMFFRRVHDSNLSHFDATTRNFSREIVGLLKESLDRQRGRTKGNAPASANP
jgi:glycosyltransferase involved in cell wall biosynthesis